MANSATERKTDIGPPHYQKFLPPIIQKNYGQWKSHEIPKPGVLVHLAESGDKLYTVRAGTSRLLSIQSIRVLCDLADKYSGGYLRFTSRHNIEFLLTDPSKVETYSSTVGRLRSVVSLDDDEIDGRDRLPQFEQCLVFGRMPAIDCGLIAGKLNHRIPRPASALRILELPRPY